MNTIRFCGMFALMFVSFVPPRMSECAEICPSGLSADLPQSCIVQVYSTSDSGRSHWESVGVLLSGERVLTGSQAIRLMDSVVVIDGAGKAHSLSCVRGSLPQIGIAILQLKDTVQLSSYPRIARYRAKEKIVDVADSLAVCSVVSRKHLDVFERTKITQHGRLLYDSTFALDGSPVFGEKGEIVAIVNRIRTGNMPRCWVVKNLAEGFEELRGPMSLTEWNDSLSAYFARLKPDERIAIAGVRKAVEKDPGKYSQELTTFYDQTGKVKRTKEVRPLSDDYLVFIDYSYDTKGRVSRMVLTVPCQGVKTIYQRHSWTDSSCIEDCGGGTRIFLSKLPTGSFEPVRTIDKNGKLVLTVDHSCTFDSVGRVVKIEHTTFNSKGVFDHKDEEYFDGFGRCVGEVHSFPGVKKQIWYDRFGTITRTWEGYSTEESDRVRETVSTSSYDYWGMPTLMLGGSPSENMRVILTYEYEYWP